MFATSSWCRRGYDVKVKTSIIIKFLYSDIVRFPRYHETYHSLDKSIVP